MLISYLSMLDTYENKSKFELIYKKYNKLMFYIANGILKNILWAEDAVHDSFVKIIENLDKIQDVDCYRTRSWIVIIVRNQSINLYNHRKKRWYIPLEKVEYMIYEDFEDVLLEYKDNTNLEQLGGLGKAIMKLPIIYRDIVTLKFIHELTNKEIATLLNINEATVRKRIERAKQRIQVSLEKEK
ncbi:RNA polymerase sigma factor [Clostridium sp. WILCCON 0269]|uniref:RNA polymerase sigma factor n=1 Tax=Candidatus Clostridium eludens TaxID=3381663 RepID=A0ABW8SKZ6_9CLOT